MILGLTRLIVDYIVFSFDFTGEDIFIYVSDLYDIFCSEQNCWFLWFGLFFRSYYPLWMSKINKLEYITKTI